MLAYLYNKDKHFVIHTDKEASEENLLTLKIALGLDSEQENNEALHLREAYKLCGGKIIQYHIKGMDEIIIAVDSTVNNKPNTNIYLFNEVTPFVETVQFINFSKENIEKILSTLINHQTAQIVLKKVFYSISYYPIFIFFSKYL